MSRKPTAAEIYGARLRGEAMPRTAADGLPGDTFRAYQPKTGERCSCKPGIQRDNCPACEGTGQRIDFAAIRARRAP